MSNPVLQRPNSDDAAHDPQSKRRAQDIDVHIGHRIRQRRIRCGFSQQDLADTLGISYQQIQKYERGQNRISAGRLFGLAQILQVDAGFFFAGLSAQDAGLSAPADARGLDGVRAIAAAAPQPELRSALLALIDAVIQSTEPPPS